MLNKGIFIILLSLWIFSDDSLGGDMYWSLGLHLYTPLPFRPGGLAEKFRTHTFATAGNLAQFTQGIEQYRFSHAIL
jgi:outer membrane protein assembly factor BamA